MGPWIPASTPARPRGGCTAESAGDGCQPHRPGPCPRPAANPSAGLAFHSGSGERRRAMTDTELAEGLVPGTPVAPFAIQAGEGPTLETPIGDVLTVKAATRQTNGSLTVLELVIGPKKGPALHTHLREDELWYVIEGDFRFRAGDAV